MPETRVIVQSRELHILEELGRGSRLSQRDLAQRLGMSLGFLNRCLQDMVENGYLKIADRSVRPFAYRVTPAGEQYRQTLTYDHYRSVVVNFRNLERRIETRLGQLKKKGARRLVFYGAGEVMAVAQKCASALGFEVIGAVDDDVQKQSALKNGIEVYAPASLGSLRPDAVLITTFRHAHDIQARVAGMPGTFLVWHL